MKKKDKTKKTIIVIIVSILVIAIVYYLFFSKSAPGSSIIGAKKLTQIEALEMSKEISNLIETENQANILLANDMTNELKKGGWVYVNYNQVTAV